MPSLRTQIATVDCSRCSRHVSSKLVKNCSSGISRRYPSNFGNTMRRSARSSRARTSTAGGLGGVDEDRAGTSHPQPCVDVRKQRELARLGDWSAVVELYIRARNPVVDKFGHERVVADNDHHGGRIAARCELSLPALEATDVT